MFVWEWTLNAPKTCPGHVLQVFRDLRIFPAALEICFYLPKYLKPLENFQWIDFWILTIQTFVVCDPDIHFAPKPYATVWRSLPWTACMQIDCFFCIISVFFWEIMKKRLAKRTKKDCLHRITRRARMYIWCKMRNFSHSTSMDRGKSETFSWTFELQFSVDRSWL